MEVDASSFISGRIPHSWKQRSRIMVRAAVVPETPDVPDAIALTAVRGDVSFDISTIEDFVLVRGNGTPVFLLANVVDDIEMAITDVVRAEEHLPNAPKQQMLWEALGHQPPAWAHVPVLVNEQRKKLSKRRDKVALEQYRDEGYLADAMINYLMTLGWSPGEDETVVALADMVERFDLADVHQPCRIQAATPLAGVEACLLDTIRTQPVADVLCLLPSSCAEVALRAAIVESEFRRVTGTRRLGMTDHKHHAIGL